MDRNRFGNESNGGRPLGWLKRNQGGERKKFSDKQPVTTECGAVHVDGELFEASVTERPGISTVGSAQFLPESVGGLTVVSARTIGGGICYRVMERLNEGKSPDAFLLYYIDRTADGRVAAMRYRNPDHLFGIYTAGGTVDVENMYQITLSPEIKPAAIELAFQSELDSMRAAVVDTVSDLKTIIGDVDIKNLLK